MPEATPAAPAPGAAPSAPALAPAPSAQSIDPSEFARLQGEVANYKRQSENWKGHKEFFDSVTGAGFKPDEFRSTILPTLQKISKRGIDFRDLDRVFAGQADEESGIEGGDKPITMADLKKWQDDQKKELDKTLAEKEYQSQFDGEYGQFSRDELKKLAAEKLGENVPDAVIDLLEAAFPTVHMGVRQPYGDDHPLKGKFMPAGSEGLGKVRGTMTGWLEKLRAHEWKSIGDDARKTPTTMGAPRGGQPPASPKKDAKETPQDKTKRYLSEAATKIAAGSRA